MVLNDEYVHAEVDEFEPTSYGGVNETANQRRVRSEQGFGGEE